MDPRPQVDLQSSVNESRKVTSGEYYIR
ncbi:hypothetical protein ACHAXS_006693 [Conticribra weissflogii]